MCEMAGFKVNFRSTSEEYDKTFARNGKPELHGSVWMQERSNHALDWEKNEETAKQANEHSSWRWFVEKERFLTSVDRIGCNVNFFSFVSAWTLLPRKNFWSAKKEPTSTLKRTLAKSNELSRRRTKLLKSGGICSHVESSNDVQIGRFDHFYVQN